MGLGTSAVALMSQPSAVLLYNWTISDTVLYETILADNGTTYDGVLADGQDLMSIINVKDPPFEAVGDGTANDTSAVQAAIDAAFGTAANPNGRANAKNNKALYFPAGSYKVTDPLVITQVSGFRIFGDGRLASQITTGQVGEGALTFNGAENGIISDIAIAGVGVAPASGSEGGVAITELDWDGTGTIDLTGITFRDCLFYGGHHGIRIGLSGNGGDSMVFLNCHFSNCGWGGLTNAGAQAVANAVVGGNFQTCRTGIYVSAGSVPAIHGVGFQNGSTNYDIEIADATYDCYSICGCRSESYNFLKALNSPSGLVAGCYMTDSNAGYLGNVTGAWTFLSCRSKNGRISCDDAAQVIMGECRFSRNDFIQIPDPKEIATNADGSTSVDVRNVRYDEDGTLKEILNRRYVADGVGGDSKYADYSVGSYTTVNLQS